MPFTATITDIPFSEDETVVLVQATITDGMIVIIRNYKLPVLENPQPTDFQKLIQQDVDALNLSQKNLTDISEQYSTAQELAIPLDANLLKKIEG